LASNYFQSERHYNPMSCLWTQQLAMLVFALETQRAVL